MEKSNSKWFIIILLAAIVVGGLVLIFKPDYRIEEIEKSNKKYYPDYKVVREQ